MAKSNDPTAELKSNARKVVASLKRLYPNAHCALIHDNPFQLLVATILSAQCTDARVNLVTPVLFRGFPDPEGLAGSAPGEVEAIIHSTGFFRAKAKNLRAMAAMLVSRHGGAVPRDLESLTELPGVGRKTANVVLGNAFGIASGVVVDTHVKRLSFRLGLTTERAPEAVERDLIRIIPKSEWALFSHRLIEHGRNVCLARSPRCGACELARFCPMLGVSKKPS